MPAPRRGCTTLPAVPRSASSRAPGPPATTGNAAGAAATATGTATLSAEALARAIVRAGRYFGAALVVGSAVQGALAQHGGRAGLVWTCVFGAAGLLLLLFTPRLADRAAVAGGLGTEIARGNAAAGIVAAGHRLATGIILSSCLYGADLPTFLTSLVFFALGFLTLLILQWLYRRLTHYADDQEVRGENAAAALSLAGVTIAFSIIVGHATWGPFTGWASSLRGYATGLVLALGLYPVRQFVVKRLLLGLPFAFRGGALDRAIAQERHVAAGAIEGLAYVATALLVTGIL